MESTPVLSFTMKKPLLDKLFSRIKQQEAQHDPSHLPAIDTYLQDIFTSGAPRFTTIDAFWTKKIKDQVAFCIPYPSYLANFVFCTRFTNNTTIIEKIVPIDDSTIKGIRQNPQTYEATLTCGLLFSTDGMTLPQQGKAICEELLRRENAEYTQRELHTLPSIEFLEQALEQAKEQAFEFVSHECKLVQPGVLELTLGPQESEKYHNQIEQLRRIGKKISLVKNRKKRVYYPATIQEWDRKQGFMTLEIDPAEEIADEELKVLPSRTRVIHDAASDVMIQRKSLLYLLNRKVRINNLPLDLFLFGDNEAFRSAIRPIYEYEIARIKLKPYLHKELNEKQEKAVKLALATPDFFFLQGPPGTGKTTFIAELCYQITQNNGTVLISSQANLAVDNALDRLKNHSDIFAVRLGNKLRIHDIGLQFHGELAIQRWLHSIIDDVKAERAQLQALQAVRAIFNDRWHELYEQYQRHEAWLAKYGGWYTFSVAEDPQSTLSQEELIQKKLDDATQALLQAERQYTMLQQLCDTGTLDPSAAELFPESQIYISIMQQINRMQSILRSNTQKPNRTFKLIDLIQQAEKYITAWQSSLYSCHLGQATEKLRRLDDTLSYLRCMLSQMPSDSRKSIQRIYEAGNKAILHIQKTIHTFGNGSNELSKTLQTEYRQALARYQQDVQSKNARYEEACAPHDYLAHQQTLQYLRACWTMLQPFISQSGKYQPEEQDGFISFAAMQQIHEEWNTPGHDQWEDQQLEQRIAILEDWWKTLENPHSSFEIPEAIQEAFIRHANVFGATCSYSGSFGFLEKIQTLRKGKKFDYVIIDEVSKATVNELLIPCLFGEKVILVGDHKQLPPVSNNEIQAMIRETAKALFGYHEDAIRMNIDIINKLFYDAFFANRFRFLEEDAREYNRAIMLTQQYRMHAHIMDAINQFYDRKLTQGIRNAEREHIIKDTWWLPDPQAHLAWIDISANPEWTHEMLGASKSKRNSDEASLIMRVLKDIIHIYSQAARYASVTPLEIGVISMYRAQKNLVQNLYSREKEHDERLRTMHPGITVDIGTVDAFQGRELDIVLLSLVLNDRHDDLTGFLKDPRRINVAMSRARRLLVIFGSKYNYVDMPGTSQEFYKNIYDIANHLQTAVPAPSDPRLERLRRQPSSFR